MVKKDFDIGRLIRALAPAQDMIDASATLAERYRDDPEALATVKKYLEAYGIVIYQPPEDTAVAYWENNPDVKAVFNAGIEDLPEFLSSADRGVRVLAKRKLDTLTEGGKDNG